MKISLPDNDGALKDYVMQGTPIEPEPLGPDAVRVVLSAAHVVADPFTDNDPSGPATLDWEATMAFRRHLAGFGAWHRRSDGHRAAWDGPRLAGGTGTHSANEGPSSPTLWCSMGAARIT